MSRRSFFLLGRDRRRRDEDTRPPAPREEDPPPPMPRPSAEGLAWQRQQGSRATGPGGLPGVISWLADYEEDDSAPALPCAAETTPLLRPPGAVAEAQFMERCTRCGDCLEACPHDAIVLAPAVYRSAAGTPYIDPASAPCRLCDDLPCIRACETGALRDDGSRMGLARVSRFDCLNAMGTSCSVCAEQCPVEGAISLTGDVPRIHEPLCTGCGVCHYVCPAPRNAVAILPNAERTP